jgi:hypothetical protein
LPLMMASWGWNTSGVLKPLVIKAVGCTCLIHMNDGLLYISKDQKWERKTLLQIWPGLIVYKWLLHIIMHSLQKVLVVDTRKRVLCPSDCMFHHSNYWTYSDETGYLWVYTRRYWTNLILVCVVQCNPKIDSYEFYQKQLITQIVVKV